MRKILAESVAVIALFVALTLGLEKDTLYADTSYTNSKTGYEALIEDEADLLTDGEAEELCELLGEVTEYCNVAFVTLEYNAGTTQGYAEDYSDTVFPSSSAVVFVVDMDNRYLYLDSSGSARKRITSAYADTITDNVYRYASNGDYFSCGYKVFEQVNALMKGQRIAQPMKYISNALLAVALSMLILFIYICATSGKRKASNREVMSGIYSSVQIHDAQAIFTNQTKTYSPPSSSSGSSGGGGGGHSGGGGGGHSGGGHSF